MSDPTNYPLTASADLAGRLTDSFLAGRSAQTLCAYRADLEDLARFLGVTGVSEIPAAMLTYGQGCANEIALRYRASLLERGLAPATVNRRLAALRSLVKLARTLGLVPFTLDVDGVRSASYRDTRGPGSAGFKKLLAQLAGRADAKGARDRAIVRLLFDLALRRGEVVSLDVADLDAAAATLAVLGKGKTERAKLTVPAVTLAALSAWLDLRGKIVGSGEWGVGSKDKPRCINSPLPTPHSQLSGPLFVSLSNATRGHRLTGQSVYDVVRRLGEGAGIRARPHGLRHASISKCLDITNGDVRKVAKFSRHKNIATVLIYDDAREDFAGELARRLAED